MHATFSRLAGLGILASLVMTAGAAHAGTVIYNTGDATTATVALGVNDNGSLNTTPNITSNAGATGLAYNFATVGGAGWQDATAPGCLCEGWGVSAVSGASSYSGYANVATDGQQNLTVAAPTAVSASTVTTSTTLTNLPGLQVVHAYAPANNASGTLFKTVVTITNTTGTTLTDVKYVRVMDWDVPPTAFSEYVTIKGTTSTTLLEQSGTNGFNTANPLAPYSSAGFACLDVDCTDAGPNDHGAYFRFNFGTLANGESYTFTTFYGAAANERDALAAIGAEKIELYSLGQSGLNGAANNDGVTFIFGFSGVGGTAQEPPNNVPEPGGLALLGLGLAGLALRRRMAR